MAGSYLYQNQESKYTFSHISLSFSCEKSPHSIVTLYLQNENVIVKEADL
jgi:hypothetical protein